MGLNSFYLGHVDDSDRERLVAQNGSVFVAFSSLQHYLQAVGVSLQEVRILSRRDRNTSEEHHTSRLSQTQSSESQE